MKMKFEFPKPIKQYLLKNRIRQKDIKAEILPSISFDFLDDDYKPVKCREIRIIINGIHKTKTNRIYISPNKISKNKPLETISASNLIPGYSVYYLIYKLS